jgi:hypothetical protein
MVTPLNIVPCERIRAGAGASPHEWMLAAISNKKTDSTLHAIDLK